MGLHSHVGSGLSPEEQCKVYEAAPNGYVGFGVSIWVDICHGGTCKWIKV